MNESSENKQEQQESVGWAAEDITPTPEHPVHKIFVGPEGLRVGWRIPLFLVITAVVGLLLTGFTAHWHPHGAAKLVQDWLIEFELFIATLVATAAMAKIESHRVGDYGLPARGLLSKNFWIGVAWGFAWLTVLMLALRLAGVFYFGGLTLHGIRILKFAAYYGLLFFTVGLFEESFVRGYLLFITARGMGFWRGAVLMSAIFGAMHFSNQGEGWIGLLGAALIGLFFCLTLRRTGTLWFAVGFHASWDWGESFFYSTPDSGQISPGHLLNSSFHGSHWLTGGSIGPEGSVLVFAVIALMWIAFDRAYREAKYPVPERISL